MKKIPLFLLVVVLFTGISLAYAQAAIQSSLKPGGAARGQQMGERQGGLLKLLGELNLTEDQKAKIKSILDEHRPNINGENKNPGPLAQLNLTEEQKTKIAEIRKASENQIDAVLTPDQKAKLDQLREEARKKNQPGPRGKGGFEELKAQIDAVLTPEQKAKLEQLLKEAQARTEERRKKQGSGGN